MTRNINPMAMYIQYSVISLANGTFKSCRKVSRDFGAYPNAIDKPPIAHTLLLFLLRYNSITSNPTANAIPKAPPNTYTDVKLVAISFAMENKK